MKARDLAALAALGIAGKMAYDKFGRKKDDEPKFKGKLGEAQSANDGDAGESEARMSKRDMNEGSGRRDAGGNTEKLSRQELDIPEKLSRQELDIPNRVSSSGGRKTDIPLPAGGGKGTGYRTDAVTKKDKETFVRPTAAGGNSKTPKVVTMPTGDDRFVTPEEGAKANKPRRYNPAADSNAASATFSSTEEGMKANVPRRTPGAADGVGPTFSSTEEGMAANVPRRTVPDYSNEGRNARTPGVASSTAEGMAAYVPRRPGQTTPQAASSSTAAGMAAYVPRRTTTASDNAQAQARMMRQGSPMAASRRNAGMPGYDEAGNPISMRSMAGQRGFDEAGNPMKRGGMVKKMASGGMTSSKMSKPSGASRGDGIAQRGRTRGTLR